MRLIVEPPFNCGSITGFVNLGDLHKLSIYVLSLIKWEHKDMMLKKKKGRCGIHQAVTVLYKYHLIFFSAWCQLL